MLLWLWSFGRFEAWAIWLNPSVFCHIDLALILVTYICPFPLVLTIGLDLRLCFHSYSHAFLKCPSAHDSSCVNAVISVKSNALWYKFIPRESGGEVLWQPQKIKTVPPIHAYQNTTFVTSHYYWAESGSLQLLDPHWRQWCDKVSLLTFLSVN